MIKLKQSPNAPVVRAGSPKDFPSVSITHQAVSKQVAGGSSAEVVSGDAVFNRYTGATYFLGGYVLQQGAGRLINKNPEVVSLGQDGLITRLQAGKAEVVLEGPIRLSLPLDLADKTEPSHQPDEFVATVSGSLSDHLSNQVDSLIDGSMTMATNGKVFTTQNHATSTYVRNPNLWCDLDLTCVSPWNSNGGVRKAGVLITPIHILNARHYNYPIGTVVRFVSADGTVYNRTIAGKSDSPSNHDFTIYTLNSALPSVGEVGAAKAITPCEVMPSDQTDFLVNNYHTRPPAICLDQEEKALIVDMADRAVFLYPTDADRLIFNENKISGDSGNPVFYTKNGRPVLITVLSSGGAGSGSQIPLSLSDFNIVMIPAADAQAGVSSGYTVTEADFSAWPNLTTKNYLIGDSGSGTKEAWVEDGNEEGRPKYRLQSNNLLRALSWGLDEDTLTTGWRVLEGQTIGVQHALVRYSDDFSADDVATPDLATFAGGYTFTNP